MNIRAKIRALGRCRASWSRRLRVTASAFAIAPVVALTAFAPVSLQEALQETLQETPIEAATVASDGPIYRVPVTDVIELGLAPFVERSLKEAEAVGARAVVLDINTPGGRVDAAQRIVDAIKASEVPVYAFVNPRAFSAGALIALATDGIYMVPTAVMGAATPVTGEGEKAPEKIVSAMRSEMRALAEARGLDPRIAEAMVDEEISIEGVVEQGKLLTLTTDEAVAVGYASEVEDWDHLVQALGLEGAPVHATETNWAESLVRFFTNPAVAPLLLSLGFLGLLVEIKTPAFGLAGVVGLTSLGLFFGSHYIVGLAGWEEMILLVVGLVLLGVEIFVVPGFGIFGLAGAAAVMGGIYLSLVGQFATGVDYSKAAGVVSATVMIVMVSAWVLIRTLPRNRRLKRSGILLDDRTGREVGYLSSDVRDDLVGKCGVALTDLRPAGTGEFDGERLDIVAEGSAWIARGSPIRIIRSEGYRHVVRAEG